MGAVGQRAHGANPSQDAELYGIGHARDFTPRKTAFQNPGVRFINITVANRAYKPTRYPWLRCPVDIEDCPRFGDIS